MISAEKGATLKIFRGSNGRYCACVTEPPGFSLSVWEENTPQEVVAEAVRVLVSNPDNRPATILLVFDWKAPKP